MTNVQSHMQKFVDEMISTDRERGVQLAAYHHGKLVVDVAAGVTDVATKKTVDAETLFPVFSVSKGVTATLVHILVQRGMMSYDKPIAMIWPEFAAHGKGNITLRHVLTHNAGLQNMPMGIGHKEMCDWDTMCSLIANLKPVNAPGAMQMYHAMTYGWLLGEVMQRVMGKSFAQLLKQEICEPLGMRSIYIGLPENRQKDVTLLEEIFPDGKEPVVDDTIPQSVPGWVQPLHKMMNREDVRRSCSPGSNGIATARALARMYASLLPGGVDGVELLPPERVRIATEYHKPIAPAEHSKIGLGYFLGGDSGIMSSRMTTFGHGGYGGSFGFADPEYEFAVGLTKNLYSPRAGQLEIVTELRKVLEIPT